MAPYFNGNAPIFIIHKQKLIEKISFFSPMYWTEQQYRLWLKSNQLISGSILSLVGISNRVDKQLG